MLTKEMGNYLSPIQSAPNLPLTAEYVKLVFSRIIILHFVTRFSVL
jgi:hypothetical protein